MNRQTPSKMNSDTRHEDEQTEIRHEDEQTDTRHEDEQKDTRHEDEQTDLQMASMQFSRRQSKENTRKCEERLQKESGEMERQECMCKNTKFTTLAVFRGTLLAVAV